MISSLLTLAKSGLTDFRINTLLRLVFIIGTMWGLLIFYQSEPFKPFTCLGVFLLLSAQIVSLFHYLQSSQRELESFFDALRYQDSTHRIHLRFKQHKKLQKSWQEIHTQLQELRQKNEMLARYYSLLLEKVPVALMVIESETERETVTLVNLAAQQLFQRSYFAETDQLEQYGAQFAQDIRQIAAGEQRRSYLLLDQLSVAIALSASIIQFQGGAKKVISIQPIQRELDRQELLAWQNLVQVFTHEIMNSMTPVVSLSKTANDLLLTQSQAQLNLDESLQDAQQAIYAVARRAEHLMQFVQAYRQIANPPQLICEDVPVKDLLQGICCLFQAQTAEIRLEHSVTPENLTLYADPVQMEQALINLVKNAIDALAGQDNGQIQLHAYIAHDSHVVIDVIDNGGGIPADKLEQIFVPFYTSKRDGTGIGLFLVKQIMQAHHGAVCALQAGQSGSILRLQF